MMNMFRFPKTREFFFTRAYPYFFCDEYHHPKIEDYKNEISFLLRQMSALIQLQRSSNGRQQLLAWYKIRDTLFGNNEARQDIKKALELAAVCEHPDAVWLTKLFGGRDVYTAKQARQVFLGCGKNDLKALAFAGLLGQREDLQQAAELGDAYAQSQMGRRTKGVERFQWAQKSAAQGERDGFWLLGRCYRNSIGCDENIERAKENFMIASELGYVVAMINSGLMIDKSDPQRFVWFGKAAVKKNAWQFLSEMEEQMQNFASGTVNAKVVFAIGRALKGHIDCEKQSIFGNGHNFDAYVVCANQALQFCESQLQSYRRSVDSWTIIGLRNGVVKDIRKMIGKMIWDLREEAEYDILLNVQPLQDLQ
jgi:hypothetical protein